MTFTRDILQGFPNTVITVTRVTDKDITKSLNYDGNTTTIVLPDTLYRLYEEAILGSGKNCTDKGDKWYMLEHNCKMNGK